MYSMICDGRTDLPRGDDKHGAVRGARKVADQIGTLFSESDARLSADVDMTIERRRFANVCEAIWQRHD
jgi:hypothetical protein